MKQFKFLAMAIFAMIMSIGFVACSSDDDDNNGGGSITSGKKLMSISADDGATASFVYGEDGKLNKALRKEGDKPDYIDVAWNGNSITITTHASWKKNPCTITLKDGKISTADDGESIQLTSYSGNFLAKTTGDCDKKYFWKDGNITKVIEDEMVYTYTYYTDKVNKHSSIDIEDLGLCEAIPAESGNLLLMAHPNLLGTGNKNLIKSVTCTGTYNGYTYNYTYNYTYELDSDGYPTKITEKSDTETLVYTLTWE